MPRFNSLQEFDEWRRGQGLSSVRKTPPKPDAALAPVSQPNGNTMPKPPDQAPDAFSYPARSSAMSMGQAPPMPRRSFNVRFRRLIPALTWITAAIAVFFIWKLFAPFTAEVVTWISSNVSPLSLGVAILAIVIAGYLVVLHHQVREVLPQDILTLRADVMRRLANIESSEHTPSEHASGEASGQTSGTSTASPGQTTIQKEFEQWMQSEQPTPSP